MTPSLRKIIIKKIKHLKDTGFFSIFIANILSKIVVFLGNIVVVRILSKNDYGIYAYAINAFSILFILDDFGATQAALQYITEQKDNKKKQQAILKYAVKLGMVGSIISGGLIFLSPIFYPYEIIEAKYLVPILCLVPILSTIKGLFGIMLRANFENKRYAILNLTETISSYIFLIPLCFFFGIKGAIISRYFYTILTLIVGVILTKKLTIKSDKNNKLEKEEKKAFTKYALVTQLNSVIGSLLIYIDTFMIGLILSNAEIVATYKVASTIPSALSFLPTCVITYAIPYFVLNNNNKAWLKDKYTKLIKYGIIGYGIFTLILIISAKFIINILYTDSYSEAIYPFIILMIGFFFSATFKIPTNNVLYAMRKLKFNLIISVFSGIFNILLNIICIKRLGIVGAAITTTSVNIFTSILGVYFVKRTLKNM